LFPYFEQPVFHLGSHPIAAFQLFVCAAVIVGHEVVVRRAARLGVTDRNTASSLTAWTIFVGFVTSHVFDVLAYHPEAVREDPLVLLKIWGSMSSFGGIFGGMIAAVVCARRHGLSLRDIFAFVDTVAFAFPFAWVFGRSGCALAHDHLGIRTDHWLAVRFPDGPRLDLGLLELLFTIGIAGLFLLLDRRPRPTGFWLAAFFTLYGPVRFLMDRLRTEDARYLGWTPGMYASVVATCLGIAALVALRRRPSPADLPAAAKG
jgi:phosphatidylglycerol:prolipoprotein diacylglycerol transferase